MISVGKGRRLNGSVDDRTADEEEGELTSWAG